MTYELYENRPNRYDQMGNNSDNLGVNTIYQNGNLLLSYKNIKIVGLNVCGLRSKLNDISFENFAIKYEIICLSKTKTDHIDLSGTILNGE